MLTEVFNRGRVLARDGHAGTIYCDVTGPSRHLLGEQSRGAGSAAAV